MQTQRYLKYESDIFIGKRRRLDRYLVCAMEGYFPVAIKTGTQSLAVVFRTGAPHIGIAATLSTTFSENGGKTWSDPIQVTPKWEDSRNPAFGLGLDGGWILAYEKAGLARYAETPNGMEYYQNKESKEDDAYLYICHSNDQGKTWTHLEPYRSKHLHAIIPYGRIIHDDKGILYMSVYGNPRSEYSKKNNVCCLLRSMDGGHSWGDETLVAEDHNETAYVFTSDQTLLAVARTVEGAVSILRSSDRGRSWSSPTPFTRIHEHPADILQLCSGKILVTFGRRLCPRGCGAVVSTDGGNNWNWDREILLAGDGDKSGDLGYPSTVQLDDGTIVTVLYYATGSEPSTTSWHWGWGEVSCQAIHYRESDIL